MTTGNYIPRIRDANNRPLPITGKVKLHVHLQKKVETVNVYVADQLASPIILGWDFCDKKIKSIRPLQRVVELDDGTSVPIVRKNTNGATKGGPPAEQIFAPLKGRTCNKIFLS